MIIQIKIGNILEYPVHVRFKQRNFRN